MTSHSTSSTAEARVARDEGTRGIRRRLRMSQRRAVGLTSLIVFLIVWQLLGQSAPVFLSYPSEILEAARGVLLVETELPRAFVETLWGLAVGYSISVALAMAIGYLMAAVRALDIALHPYVTALYATPRIALIPLLVLWVGIAFELRVSIVVLSSIFPMILTIRDGARTCAEDYTDVARSFVATGWQTWRTTTLPGSLPFVFAALRIGLQKALIGVIVAEMTASVAGTGRLLLEYGRYFQTDKLLVPVVIIGVFSILLTTTLKWLHRAVTPWRRRDAA